MNGGYIMIDATGLDVSVTTEQTVNGIYDQIEAAAKSGKMIMMNGADNDGTVISPFVVQCEAGSNAYTLKNGVYVFAVASDDGVTVSAAGPGSDVVSFPGFPNFGDELIGATDWVDDTYITLEHDGFVFGSIKGTEETSAIMTVEHPGTGADYWEIEIVRADGNPAGVFFYIKAGMKIKVEDAADNTIAVYGLFN